MNQRSEAEPYATATIAVHETHVESCVPIYHQRKAKPTSRIASTSELPLNVGHCIAACQPSCNRCVQGTTWDLLARSWHKSNWNQFADHGVIISYKQKDLYFIPKDNVGRGDCLFYTLLDTGYFRSIRDCSDFRRKLFSIELHNNPDIHTIFRHGRDIYTTAVTFAKYGE